MNSVLEKTFVSILKDDFTDQVSIEFSEIAGHARNTLELYHHDAASWVYRALIHLWIKDSKPHLYIIDPYHSVESAILLFQDEMRITLKNSFGLSMDELMLIASKDFVKAKVYLKNGETYVCSFDKAFQDSQYRTKQEGQYLLKLMAAKLLHQLIKPAV